MVEMPMMHGIFLISLLLLTFLLRGTYRLLVPSGLAPSGDAVVHLIIADGIRRNRHRIPEGFPRFLLSGPHTYPSFFHWILSFIPRKTLERWEPFVGTSIEMIHVSTIYLACFLIAREQGVENPALVGFLAGAIFALTPLFVDHVGRVFLLSERPFGTWLGTIYLYFALRYVIQSDPWSLLLAAGLMGILFISSKFSVQAIVFVSAVFSLLTWTLEPWIPVVTGLGAVSLVSRGYALKVLRGHFRHSVFYRNYLLKHYLQPQSQYRDLVEALIRGLRNPRRLLQSFFTNSLLKIVSTVPWILLMIALAIVNRGEDWGPWLQSALLWVLSCIFVTCLITIKGLRFLGEPERYLEFGIFPLALITSILLIRTKAPSSWILFGLIGAYGFLVFWRIIARARKHSLWDGEQEKICNWLEGKRFSKIMTIPLKAVSLLVYRTGHSGLNILTNISETDQQEQFKELCPVLYPFPNSDLVKVAGAYDLDFIIVHKPSLSLLERNGQGIEYDFSSFKTDYENSSYIVYRVEKGSHPPLKGMSGNDV